jgi:carbon-monoxide dehydrogenase small subunit
MSTVKISFKLNGRDMSVEVLPNTLLVDLLRDILGLKGTKVGCREGECGVCAVLLDGEAVNSCILPAAKVGGKSVVTIEGLVKEDGQLHPIQQAFISEGAVQCGFCTPGMIMNTKALLDKNPKPSDGEIRQGISGVLCRCTGYHKIVQAIKAASQARNREKS